MTAAPASSTALDGVRALGALIARRGLGAELQVDVVRGVTATPEASDPTFWSGGGVLAEEGPEILGLLAAWFGGLTIEDYVDDSAGGPEAECVLRLKADGARCTVELSRLRRLGNRIRLSGPKGWATLDLINGEVRAEPAAVLDGEQVEIPPPEGDKARTLVAEAYGRRRRGLHVWERSEDRAPGPLAGRKVLVTGGLGFIGARLVEVLADQGAEVAVASRDLRRAARVARMGVELIRLRPGDAKGLQTAVEGRSVVFNLAYDFRRSAASNFAAYERLADACAAAGVGRLVQASSIAVYDGWPDRDIDEASPKDGPGHIYKVTKRLIEQDLGRRAAAGQFEAAIVQPSIVYGAFSSQWTDGFVEQMRERPTRLPAERGLCNGVHIDDTVDAFIAAGTKPDLPAAGLIVSGPQPFSWTRLFEGYGHAAGGELLASSGELATVRSGPTLFGRIESFVLGPVAGRLVDWLKDRLGENGIAWIRARLRRSAPPASVYDPTGADPAFFAAEGVCSVTETSRRLGPPRVDIDEGLRRTAAYIRWRYDKAAFDSLSRSA